MSGGGGVKSSAASTVGDDDGLCCVCMSGDANCVLVHSDSTGHQCVCMDCGRDLKARGAPCPICRKDIRDAIQNFK